MLYISLPSQVAKFKFSAAEEWQGCLIHKPNILNQGAAILWYGEGKICQNVSNLEPQWATTMQLKITGTVKPLLY